MTPPPFHPPSGYSRVRVVHSFDELVTTPFGGGVNVYAASAAAIDRFLGEAWPKIAALAGINRSGGEKMTND